MCVKDVPSDEVAEDSSHHRVGGEVIHAGDAVTETVVAVP